MSHSYTAGMTTRRRKLRRAVLVGALLGAVAFAAWAVWSLRPARDDAPPPPSATACPTPPAGVTVDVYNATSRVGLARLTADALRAQRFTVGQAVNAPAGTKISAPAEVRHGPAGTAGATVLAHRITGAVLVPVKRKGTHVDLVIGPDFDAVTVPSAAPTC